MSLQATTAGLFTVAGASKEGKSRPSIGPQHLRSGFFAPSIRLLRAKSRPSAAVAAPKFSMRVASRQAYICRDCGYIYNDKTPSRSFPTSSSAPFAGAEEEIQGIRDSVSKDANRLDVRKARKEQLKQDESIGKALPIGIAVGAVALVGLYFFLNNSF